MHYCLKTLLKPFVILLFLVGGLANSNVSGATSATYPVGLEPKAVVVADFNNDGKKDLASVNRGGHTVSILLGDGAGNFGAATNFSTGDTFSEPFGLAVGDFNNDDKTDVVISKPNVGSVSLLLGNGSGGLGAPVDFSVGESPARFGVSDFNGDGKLDLAVLDFGFNQGGIYILLGTGTGSFGSPTRIILSGRPGSVVVADFNRDNKSDLVVSHGGIGTNKISLLLGNGSGGFSGPSDVAVGLAGALVVGDFNKDNFLDIASGNGDLATVSILKGNGQGSFDAPMTFPTNTSATSITSGDFDGDGKLDLAVGSGQTGDRISIVRGDDTGQFISRGSFSAGSGPYDLTAGDFTGNGVTGLAVANASSNTLSVLIGPLPSLSITAASVIEGNSGTVPASFLLTLSSSINQEVTIFYTLSSETASGGSDFDNTTISVTIPAGSLTASLVVPVNGDQTFELDETFTVNINSSLNAFILNGLAQGTIVNDDPIPAITINDVSIIEGNSGSKNFLFTVSLSNPSFQPISVTATTADSTATAGIDYVAKSANVNIAPGQLSGPLFNVIVNSDTQSELNEIFLVSLTSPVNASIARPQAIGTIIDDDPAALLVDASQRAIALDSVTLLRDPFSFVNTFNFSLDTRTRIILFAVNLNLVAGDVVTVQAEDAQHVNHQLPVEFIGGVPNFGGLSQIVVKLPDNLGSGDFMVSFTLRGITSNKGVITIKP